MGIDDALHRAGDAVHDDLAALGAGDVDEVSLAVRGPQLGELLRALLAREALEAAVAALAEALVDAGERRAEHRGDDLGGLARSAQIARRDGADLSAMQTLGERASLRAARVVELDVGMALEPTREVPVGLAVPYEKQPAHGHSITRRGPRVKRAAMVILNEESGMPQPFCLYCRAVLRGPLTCEPEHPVVDLATDQGREGLRSESFVATTAGGVELRRTWAWQRLLPMGLVAMGFAFVAARQFFAAVVVGMVAGAMIAVGALRSDARRILPLKPQLRALGARALPAPSPSAERMVGTIVSGTPMPGPFTGGECVGWVVEISLAEAGVMLRDGETRGLGIELRDGRGLRVPPGTLRMHMRARSDSMSSEALAQYVVRFEEGEELIRWDEARVLELRVGDQVELTAEVTGDDAIGYRGTGSLSFMTLDAPFVRRA